MRNTKWLLVIATLALAIPGRFVSIASAAEPVAIGQRLELLVDDLLVDSISGDAQRVLHQPTPHDVALVTDKPWEGNTSAYYSIFQDGDLYRMYYRGSHFDKAAQKAAHPEVTCYAESRDGVHWRKPDLGLIEYAGSKANNIVWDGIGTHCLTPFRDANPAALPDAKYKAISRGRPRGKRGLYVFKSPDGIRWSLMHDEPVITVGAFDSQNLAFWDAHRGKYFGFHRTFNEGVRDIMATTSTNFLEWSEPQLLEYPGAEKQHLYTNAIRPYPRAPHLLIGFPTRYLPNEDSRVEPTFMSSRDGRTFHRWNEPVISEDAPQDRGGNRSNYMAWGLVQVPDEPNRYSVYGTEAYYTGPDCRIRRFSFRFDGFVSLQGGAAGGELLTKPLSFAGERLELNFSTASGGELRVELQDASGTPIPGFQLNECWPLRGDEIRGAVQWKGDKRLSELAGRPVRVRFQVRDGDLYSFRFAAL